MTMTFEEAEKLLADIELKLDQLKELKITANNWPVPVMKDRNGKLTKDYTLKEWLMKLHEEVIEFEHEISIFRLDSNPERASYEISHDTKMGIAGEACDTITVICGICRQFGITEEMLRKAMHDTYVKNKNRGYLHE